MKKLQLVLTVLIIFTLAGIIWADPPVNPPVEGFKITTDTNIVAVGIVKESEDFTWHWNNTASAGVANSNGIQPIANRPGQLGANETEAKIRYTEEFKSFNTLAGAGDFGRNLRAEAEPEETPLTTFNKTFVADSHPVDSPNVTVDKVIGYTSDGAPGSVADFKDKIAIEEVSAGGDQSGAFAGVFVLCPWVSVNVKELPAVNAGVAMGSSFNIPNLMANGTKGSISANIESGAEMTSQIKLGYDIMATGAGTVSAEMLAKLYDGTEAATSNNNVNTTPLASFATYSEYAEASGIFIPFHRKMDFGAYFSKPSLIPEIIDQVLP